MGERGRRVRRLVPVALLVTSGLWSGVGVQPAGAAAICANDQTGLPPLTDGAPGETYQGEALGLYPGGVNTPPPAHTARGVDLAAEMVPLDADGVPDPAGQMVFLGLGTSNVNGEFGDFMATVAPTINPSVTMVNGGHGGNDLRDWVDPDSLLWAATEVRLTDAGATTAQVTAIWMQNPVGRNSGDDFTAWVDLNADLTGELIVELAVRYPNLRQVYVSSRSYGGYIDNTGGVVEPYSYEHGYAMRRVVGESIADPSGLWVDWGPYLWTDGVAGRDDGMVWACADVVGSGSHSSDSGKDKITALLDAFFSDAPTSPWFRPDTPPAPVTVTGTTPSSLARGVRQVTVAVSGSSFEVGATVSFGAGVRVRSATVSSSTSIAAVVSVPATATPGPRTVTVTNPGGEVAVCGGCFTVT